MKRRLLHDGLLVVGLLVAFDFALLLTASPGAAEPRDVHAYWLAARGDMYARSTVGDLFAYVYPPAFAQALAPLASLPLDAFIIGWRLAIVAVLAILAGPLLLLVIFTPPVASELNLGNIHVFLALVSVAGLRYPWLWSFAFLTKVTPGIGVLWFAVRREWRKLAVALGTTGLIALVSFLLAPAAWFEWFGVLAANAGGHEDWRVPIPFVVRFPVALAVVIWGARTDRPWTVPVSSMLALPVMWFVSLSMLVGLCPALLQRARLRWPSLRRPRLGPVTART